ncbi:phycocyanobilin:ferredoxin oxidoreductase [uncultured Caudovirales phage]|uniref:Phycocyanobilin:ferredoxin oxidoreductase n=1 Tax=uncultured Caudovirales phage TaxID=2100421 RepID=A0A6J5KVX0_9CAUD|nr:phycocyanobilin:ferredoxin oxidoreductase [uncultured Caudovirales phage]CAB5208701.1 phycocyanobilin:ferredoxin oxidoreductase [uncultured Caudovirales phage]
MNSNVWDTLIGVQQLLESKFDETGTEIFEPGMDRFNQPGWVNRVWTSGLYRRAHIDVVDARETKGLWMMHCCVFPHTHNPAPIYGFDVIAGKNKITGCFHDFSPAGDSDHPLIDWFSENTRDLQWNKTRKLPEWAERIFTGSMIAAGNVQKEEELAQIFAIANKTIKHYLSAISETNNTINNTTDAQNYYAINQKQNPHTPKVMASLGLSEEDVAVFIQDCLFPEIR